MQYMVRKVHMLFMIASSVSLSLHGQDHLYINRTLQDFASEMRFVGTPAGRSYINFEGSEYLDENFVNGEILTLNAEHYKDIPMRYNAFLDKIEIRLPNGNVYDLADPTQIFQILLNKEVLVYTDFLSAEGPRTGYLYLLYDGGSKLYRRNYKVFKEGTPSNGILAAIPSKIVDKPIDYYIKIHSDTSLLCNSRKDLLNILGSHSAEMNDYLKKEKLNVKKEEDLIKMLIYFDTL